MAKIKSNPGTDSYTAVHWLRPADKVYRCLGKLAGGVPCGSRSDDDADAFLVHTIDGETDYNCVNGCTAGYETLGPAKVIVEVGADASLLNLILPGDVCITVWGNGDAAVFTDPDDELGENPDLRIERGKILPGGYDNSLAKAIQHQ